MNKTPEKAWRSRWSRAVRHPLPLPMALLAVVSYTLLRVTPRNEHSPLYAILTVGACIIVTAWLTVRDSFERALKVGDSFDFVTRELRPRLERMEAYREHQLRYNRTERKRIADLGLRVENIEQHPMFGAATRRR